MNLTPTDIADLTRLRITTVILAEAQLHRVDDIDARQLLSTRRTGDMSGIVFPYLHPLSNNIVTRCLRRDHPDMEDGKPSRKYLYAYGDPSHIYFPPLLNGRLTDVSVRLFVVEAQKSVLSLASAGEFAIGLGGCWGWRGRIGRVVDANGTRVDELGPLPDLDHIEWTGRQVILAFDSNTAANKKVQAARRMLAQELAGRGAVIKLLDVPAEPGINGPDDYIGAHGAGAFFALLETAAETDGNRWPYTEVGDAECFTHTHSSEVRYDHAQGRWLLTSETGVWVPDPTEILRGFTINVMRRRQKDAVQLADADDRRRAFKWSIDGESSRRLSNTLREARAMPPISDDGTNWDLNSWLLGTQNGLIDLQTGIFRRGIPEDRVTLRVREKYDEDAKCPLWERTVNEVFDNDSALIDYVWKALGYSISGDCREECFFVNWGGGGNGKGTIMNTVAWVLKEYADNLPFSSFEMTDRTSIPTDIAKLVGRRFVTSSESSGETVHLNEARVKALTGQDPITARFLHQNFFTFQPVAKFWLASNLKPVVKDESDGFWRRVRLIPFTQSFVGNENKTLKQDLRKESAGILAWLVRGCLEWQEKGLDPPATVTVATQVYREESDPLAVFFADRCVQNVDARVQASVLYGQYRKWAEQCGLKGRDCLSLTAFGTHMRKQFTVDEGRAVIYLGIGLRAGVEAPPDV